MSLEDSFGFVLAEVEEKTKDEFAWNLINTAADNFQKMKLVLKTFAPEFPFEKIAPINRVVLILGLTEMKFIGTPPIVVINEYVELAKSFGENKSAGFVNAVLDSFRKTLGLSNEKVKEEGDGVVD